MPLRNNERMYHSYLSRKISVKYTRCALSNAMLKTRNFTKNVWAYSHFWHPEILLFLMADISFIITLTKLKITQRLKRSFNFKNNVLFSMIILLCNFVWWWSKMETMMSSKIHQSTGQAGISSDLGGGWRGNRGVSIPVGVRSKPKIPYLQKIIMTLFTVKLGKP